MCTCLNLIISVITSLHYLMLLQDTRPLILTGQRRMGKGPLGGYSVFPGAYADVRPADEPASRPYGLF